MLYMEQVQRAVSGEAIAARIQVIPLAEAVVQPAAKV